MYSSKRINPIKKSSADDNNRGNSNQDDKKEEPNINEPIYTDDIDDTADTNRTPSNAVRFNRPTQIEYINVDDMISFKHIKLFPIEKFKAFFENRYKEILLNLIEIDMVDYPNKLLFLPNPIQLTSYLENKSFSFLNTEGFNRR